MLSNEKMEVQVKKKVLLGAMLAVGLFASMTVWSPMEVWAEDGAGVEAISVEPLAMWWSKNLKCQILVREILRLRYMPHHIQ